jgi:hypothetical protein
MKKTVCIIAVIIYSLHACNEKKENKNPVKDIIIEAPSDIVKTNSIDYCQLCLNFLISYQENYDKIYERDFINYEGNFSINFENLEYFIDKSQMKKFFTNKFITNFKGELLKINENLKKNPQNDGVIDGLEGDVFLRTQEIEDCLNQIANKKITCNELEANKVKVDFHNNHILIFTLSENKIDDIKIKD